MEPAISRLLPRGSGNSCGPAEQFPFGYSCAQLSVFLSGPPFPGRAGLQTAAPSMRSCKLEELQGYCSAKTCISAVV